MTSLHAHVVGSMLRTSELLDARQRREQDSISPAEFTELEDRAVDRAIEVQEHAGIDVITDGEQRRFDFMGSLLQSVSGFEYIPPDDATVLEGDFWHTDDPDAETTPWVPPVVTSRIGRTSSLAGEEYSYA